MEQLRKRIGKALDKYLKSFEEAMAQHWKGIEKQCTNNAKSFDKYSSRIRNALQRKKCDEKLSLCKRFGKAIEK